MRLFVALPLPPEVLAQLDAALVAVRADHPEPRWVPAQRWHLTLAFLGEVEERAVPELGERLARAAARRGPLELALAGAGRFGSGVLWVGLTGEVGRLSRLAEAIAAAARRTGIEVEDRRFRPHLTVARGRAAAGRPADLRPAAAALAAYEGPGFRAGHVALVRSVLGPQPAYTELAAWPLGAGD
ncbi:RNA 2',3'-cyclic phosphodiesterase [Motilibacter aurantiacus]|uniref:RNA 2',3'-cyclic phosphodiesterase n=1 Tax=Motilibacter aurantiacus TaxID=2714955 RepID=UPI00140ABB99|nr:RNA 2',3'-cyclic phosphodiesterase [Motilibacter aurantiacus]